jgi:hypothetical protein
MTKDDNKLVLPRDWVGSVVSKRRRAQLLQAGLPRPATVLEVGAFDNPTVRGSDGFTVRYADIKTTQSLRRQWGNKPGRDPERFVEVDHVVRRGVLSPFVLESFDLVIACQVLQLVPDPIGWLVDLARVCTPDAAVFLTLPDQRYTFDYYKQPTDLVGLVRAHETRKTEPDAYDVARMRYLHTHVDVAALHDGQAPPPPVKPASFRALLEEARHAVALGAEPHCHFFTSDSFMAIADELHRSHYVPWTAKRVADVEPGSNEFAVLLHRTSAQ